MFELVHVVAVSLLGVLVADGAFTILVLKNGGRELNPFMSMIIGKIGLTAAIVASRGLAIALVVVFWVMNVIPFLIGLLVPTAVFVCWGAYSTVKV